MLSIHGRFQILIQNEFLRAYAGKGKVAAAALLSPTGGVIVFAISWAELASTVQDQHGKLERRAVFPIESSLVKDVRGAASQVNISSAVRRIRCGVIIHKVVPSYHHRVVTRMQSADSEDATAATWCCYFTRNMTLLGR